jgi:ABC-type branched-subunit amino acid transport system substrate-binding protein
MEGHAGRSRRDWTMIVKIGAVAATSGPVGLLGRSFLKAVQLAFEDLRNTTHQYQLIIEELQSPDQAEPAVEKLVDAINALVIGVFEFKRARPVSMPSGWLRSVIGVVG